MQKEIVINGRTIKYNLTYKSVRNVNIRIKPDGSVNVSANRLTGINRIEALIKDKAEFIFKALDRFAAHESKSKSEFYYINGSVINILGAEKKVEIIKGEHCNIAFDEGTLFVYVPDTLDEAGIRSTIDEYLQGICKHHINEICQRVFPCFKWQGIDYPEIRFRKMKSQWGNCRPKSGVLTFNTYLAFVPVRCMEYVVIHEFVHFLHPNHSRDFYDCVEKYLPDWKERKAELEKFSSAIV